MSQSEPTRGIASALVLKQRIQLKRLALQIHDASMPSLPHEEVGRGSPYSYGAEQFFQFAAELGFDTIQFGPQGMTGRGNASPYDAAIFSRNPLNLPLARLVDEGRLPRTSYAEFLALLPTDREGTPYTVLYDAFTIAQRALIESASKDDRAAAQEFLHTNATWLIPDALYHVLSRIHGSQSWLEWDQTSQGEFDQRLFAPQSDDVDAAAKRLDELRAQYAQEIEDYAQIQFLLSTQHQALRRRLSTLGLELFTDLQVGVSLQDYWAHQGLFLAGYRVGAPPSRTTQAGQPWGYPVFDPAKFGTAEAPGPVLRFVQARLRKAVEECDGVRIDHPHGWIDPWVYRDDDPDPFHAVQNGARLFSTPDDPTHPRLHAFAIATPEQLNRQVRPYEDERVQGLNPSQVARYAALIDEVVAAMPASRSPDELIACEVLSTLPRQVGEVMHRHGLGRFRVVQKINLHDPADVYRVEHAQPADWVMLGTHDSPPIWALAKAWCENDQGPAWREYLAQRKVATLNSPPAAECQEGVLVNDIFAALLACQAQYVLVFFADLFGMTRRYNEPGLISDVNWNLRAPRDFVKEYEARLATGQALDVRRAIFVTAQAAGPR